MRNWPSVATGRRSPPTASSVPCMTNTASPRDKEKFLRGHEGEIILFEATARELKRLDAVPLPATQRLRAEMDELATRRTALQTELRKIQKEEKEYDMIHTHKKKKNIDILLSNQNNRSKTKDHEIE